MQLESVQALIPPALGPMTSRMRIALPLMLTLALGSVACSKQSQPSSEGATAETAAKTPKDDKAKAATAKPKADTPTAEAAKLGAPAPDFELTGLDGKTHKLSDHKGKIVVLEWFNPECPFVKNSHTKGSLIETAKNHTAKGVVWLAINSGAEGKQGHGKETNEAGVKSFKLEHPVLLDESGKVGRMYGAKRTPHMYVIDKDGKLVYRGAIDNSPDGEGESPTGGKLINHVDAAIEDLTAGREVKVKETEAYGCGVKYGKS